MKMHVLFVTHLFGRLGGLETYNLGVAHALQRLGHDVRVVAALSSCSGFCERIPTTGLMPRNRVLARAFGRLWRRRLAGALPLLCSGVDVILAGHAMVLPVVERCARKHRIQCWALAFGIEVWGDWSAETAEAFARCDRVIAISDYTAASVRRRLGGDDDRVAVIHPAVDTARFAPAREARNPGPVAPAVILTVGRFSAAEAYKGHDLVIRALPAIRDSLPRPVEYWIVGEGDDETRLRQVAGENNVGDIVRFKGAVGEDELVEFYRRCDVFAMPSRLERRGDGTWAGEGFGIVYAEAAACGKPVVACDLGGQTDIVRDGITGFLAEPSVEAVGRAILRLLTDPADAKRMGEAGRRLVVESFGTDSFDAAWARLLESIRHDR